MFYCKTEVYRDWFSKKIKKTPAWNDTNIFHKFKEFYFKLFLEQNDYLKHLIDE